MVAGNVCMNLMYAIGYPAFQITGSGDKPIIQPVEPAATMDATAMLNGQSVQVGESVIGLNPIAAALKSRSKD